MAVHLGGCKPPSLPAYCPVRCRCIQLAHAHVGTFEDDPGVWPAEMWLNGSLATRSVTPPTGSPWPSASTGQPRPLGYRPQPYEQPAAYCRRTGHKNDVRSVLLAKQRHR